jgi:hexulose-6-phosphate isomerase
VKAGAFSMAASAFLSTPFRGDLVAADKKRPMKKAINLGMIAGKMPVMDKFKLAKDLGFDGLEVGGPNDPQKPEILKARDATGLKIASVMNSVHWGSPLSDPDPSVRARGLEGLKGALRDAKDYACSAVLLVPAVVNKKVSYDEAYTRSQAEIRKAIPLAEELGVKIAIENVWNQFLLSPLEAARYVDEFQSPLVGWFFDAGNIVNYGWPEQWIRILNKRILKVHIKEYSRTKRDKEGLWKGFDAELTEGDNDWPAVMKALDDIGYQDFIIAEIGGGDEKRLQDIADRMDRIIGS